MDPRLFPQSQRVDWRAGSPDARRALDILAEVEKDYRIDPCRVYLTGISMGGYGTWSLAARYPDRWAASGTWECGCASSSATC